MLILFYASGCAAIVNGTRDTLQVSLNYNLPRDLAVTDINVTVAGQDMPHGGGLVIVERGAGGIPVRAKCTKPGYIVNTSPSLIQPSFGVGWFIWELLLPPGLLGMIVDFATGAYWNYPVVVPVGVTATPIRQAEP